MTNKILMRPERSTRENVLESIGKEKRLGNLLEYRKDKGCFLAKYSLSEEILSVKCDDSGEIANSPEMKDASTYDWDKAEKCSVQDNPEGVTLISLADVKMEPINWLWKNWLPASMLTILAGAPGCGKTTIALSFAATLATGGTWPDGTKCSESGKTVIWSGEDDISQTIKPRLVAMGADCKKISFCRSTKKAGDKESKPFDPAEDMRELENTIKQEGNVRLLIIDSIVSAVPGDSHRNNETRLALQPIVDLAGKTKCAVIGITHFSKGTQGRNPTERVNGSVAFGAVARIVLVAAKGHQPKDKCILTVSKANNCPTDDHSFEYEIRGTVVQDETTGGNIETSLIEWGEKISGDAQTLLDKAEGVTGRADGGNINEASEFLKEYLKDGEHPCAEIQKAAKEDGITQKTLRTASERLKVIKTRGKKGDTNRKTGLSYWSLPRENDVASWNARDLTDDDAA